MLAPSNFTTGNGAYPLPQQSSVGCLVFNEDNFFFYGPKFFFADSRTYYKSENKR